MSRFHQTAHGNRGFTLVEVIAALLIIGIIAAAVTYRMIWSMPDVDSASRADKLKVQLRYAQGRSMNTDSVWGIQFSGSTYHLFKNGNASDGVILPGEDNLNISLPSGCSITQIVSFDNNRGRPCTDAGAQTLSASDITLDVAGHIITIYKNTGYIP